MSGKLEGRAAVVTGAARGIGRAIVHRLTADGAQVAALDMNVEEARQSGGAMAIQCNVTDAASVAAALAEARAGFGRLDIAVANAGIGQAEGDGSGPFYEAMGQRNAEMADKGSSSIFVDQLIHMEDRGWDAVMSVTTRPMVT